MSPVQAMERSYGALKAMLRDGVFLPGTRLEANRLADDLGVSMTPVRDVLHRLVGERLIDGAGGDGFHVPRISEGELRDLYEWNAALLSMAARTARSSGSVPPNSPSATLSEADRVTMVFDAIATAAPNPELRLAITNISDRLHPFRLIEDQVLSAVADELQEIAGPQAQQAQAIRRYHLRRMRAAPALIRHRERQTTRS